MKKRMLLMVAAMLTISLMACGQADNQTDSANTSNETVTEVEKDSEENVVTETEAPITAVEETTETAAPEVEEDIEDLHIKDLFAEHGLKAGTCITTSMIRNPSSSSLITSQFNSVTMENSMKPDYLFNKKKSVEAGNLVVEFNDDMIKMLDWAKANDMAVRGHTLVWYSQTPGWIFYQDFDTKKGLVGREEMLARLDSYIKQVFEGLEEKGYIDLFYAYDVVNEAWMEDGKMRDNKWKQTIGDDYLWQAFYIADKYAPESIDLYYNDYNEQFKTTTLVKFAETLKDENGNYLIDGIGFQAHLYTSDDLTKYFKTVDTIAELGLKVQLTELDVCLGSYQHPLDATEDNTKKQGKFVYNLINGLLERVDNGTINMDAITFWGYKDSASWRKEYSPLLYDKNSNPKEAYYGAMQIKEKAGF